MVAIPNDSSSQAAPDTGHRIRTARQTHWLFIWIYIWSSVAAVAVTFFLVLVGLEYNLYQWLLLMFVTPAVMISYIVPDIYMIGRHYAPIGKALRALDAGQSPSNEDASAAIVRTLNLPFYSFLRVTLFHGPAASLTLGFSLVLNNWFFDAGYLDWQIFGFMLTIFFFAAPAHAIFGFFSIAKYVIPIVERLWAHCDRIEPEHQKALISIRLRNKLLYLSVFITALPLLFFAASIPFKVDIVLAHLGFDISFAQLTPLLTWVAGVVIVCMGGALAMSALTASEVSRSASQLAGAMQAVENGDLANDLRITGTDEYAELFRGFNLMVSSLREEVQILELSHDLAGELNLDVLLGRIMAATTELLDADRSTLFLLDKKKPASCSRASPAVWRSMRSAYRQTRELPAPCSKLKISRTSTNPITTPASIVRSISQRGIAPRAFWRCRSSTNPVIALALPKCSTNTVVASSPRMNPALVHLYQRRKILTRKGFPFWAGCDSRLAKEIRHVSMHCSSGRLRQH